MLLFITLIYYIIYHIIIITLRYFCSESIVSEHVDWFYAQKEIFEKQGCTLHEMNSKYAVMFSYQIYTYIDFFLIKFSVMNALPLN
jgi:hypothetical protein